MKLVVVSPGGQPREVAIMSAVKNLPKTYDFTKGSDIWQVIRESQNDQQRYKPRSVEQGTSCVEAAGLHDKRR